MKNYSIYFLILAFLVTSCAGGGGSSPFVLTVQQFSSFTVNEDDSYQTVISASTNKPSNISYSISKPSINAAVSISSEGSLSYTPNPNYFGNDSFIITVSATQESSSTNESFSETFVYPNPIRPGFDMLNKKIKISGLTDNCNIKITDIEGNLVAEAQSKINRRYNNFSYINCLSCALFVSSATMDDFLNET